MRWILLTASLLLILGAAIAYSLWEPAVELPPHHEPVAPVAVAPPRPRPMADEPVAPPPPPVAKADPLAPAWVPQPAPPPPPPLPDQAPMVGLDDEVAQPDAGRVELTTAVAQGALRTKLPDLQRCYQTWAEGQGAAAPKRFVYTFVIEPTADHQAGEVSKVEISGAPNTAGLEACAKDVAKGIAFDAPKGPVRVPLPFSTFSGHAVKQEMSRGMEP